MIERKKIVYVTTAIIACAIPFLTQSPYVIKVLAGGVMVLGVVLGGMIFIKKRKSLRPPVLPRGRKKVKEEE